MLLIKVIQRAKTVEVRQDSRSDVWSYWSQLWHTPRQVEMQMGWHEYVSFQIQYGTHLDWLSPVFIAVEGMMHTILCLQRGRMKIAGAEHKNDIIPSNFCSGRLPSY